MQNQQPQQQQQLPMTQEYFLQAIQTMFQQNTQVSQKDFEQANTYLISFERSKEAWPLCTQILANMTQYPETVIFHAAKILKTKLQYDFAQLQQEEIQQFGKQIIDIISNIASQKLARNLRGQFSLILIYVYFHTYRTWPDFIGFLKEKFYGNQDCHAFLYNVYLEIPDEVNNSHIVIDEEVRDLLFKHLKEDFQMRIIQELSVLGSGEGDTQKQYYALKCFRNWLEFCYNKQVWDLLENHPLLELALNSTEDTELQIKAENVICSILNEIQDPECHKSLFLKIANKVFGYFEKCASAIKEDLPEEVDIYMRIFKIFGKRALPDFIKNPDATAQKYLQNFLELTEIEDIDNSDETCSFWRRFFKIISDYPKAERQNALQVYENLIRKVIHVSVKRSAFSVCHFNEFNTTKPKHIESIKEAYEIKNRERVSMKSVLQFACKAIGLSLGIKIIGDDLLQPTIQSFNQLIQNPDQNPQQQQSVSCQLEGILSCIHYCVESQDDEEQIEAMDYMLVILKVILEDIGGKSDQIRLLKSCLKYFVSFPHYLTGNQELQARAFKFLSENLSRKFLGDTASEGFEKLCERNKEFVKSNLGDFLQLLEKFSGNEEIVSGLAIAICSDDGYIQQYLVQLCMPYAGNLKKIMDCSYDYQPGETKINALVDQFDKLTLIVSLVPKRESGFPHELVQAIYKEVWPLLMHLMDNERAEKIIEKIARFIKYVMRCLKNDFAPFLQDLFNCVLRNFEKEPISSYLYIIEFTTTVFNENTEYTIYLSETLTKVLELCFSYFGKFDSVLQAFEEEPNLTEDFFGMLNRIMKYAPEVMLHVDKFIPVFELIVQAHLLQHIKAAQTMYMYAEYLYIVFFPRNLEKIAQEKLQYYQKLRENLVQISPSLMLKLLQAVAQYPPESVCDYICDCVLAMIKAFPQESQGWFMEAAKQAFSVDVLTEGEKNKYVGMFLGVNQGEDGEGQVIEFLKLVTERCMRSYMRQN